MAPSTKLPAGSLIIPASAQFAMRKEGAYQFGDYLAAENNRKRKLYGPMRTSHESDMLPQWDRSKVVAYLRRAMRNNPIVAGIVYRYVLGIGAATVHVAGESTVRNDALERYLSRKFARITYGTGQDLDELNRIITAEKVIAGEVFLVWTRLGTVQVIPSELCGSPDKPAAGEVEGITYDSTGTPLRYRFGVRRPDGQISFNANDGATLVDASFVWHLARFDRAEQRRGIPLMAPCVPAIQDLDEIVEAKVQSVKNQAALSVFITKMFDPATQAELAALGHTSSGGASGSYYADMLTARSDYQQMRSGTIMYGEIGEDAKMLAPNLQAAEFDTFLLSRLDAICAPLGIPPEEAVVGYRRSNYSSSRAEKLRWRQVIDRERRDREVMLDDLALWQVRRGVLFGELPAGTAGAVGEDFTDTLTWGWPPLPEIDEAKHAQAQSTWYQSGFTSRRDVAAERGQYWDQLEQQLIREAVFRLQEVQRQATAAKLDPEVVMKLLPGMEAAAPAPAQPAQPDDEQAADDNGDDAVPVDEPAPQQ